MIFTPAAISSYVEMSAKEHIAELKKTMPDLVIEPTTVTMTIKMDPQVPGGIAISANGVAFPQSTPKDEYEQRKLDWLMSGDTGVSSQAIFSVLEGRMPHNTTHNWPYDPSDFGRCLRMLERIPEFRPRLKEVSIAMPAWKPMIDAWDQIESFYKSEVEASGRWGSAPQTYELIKQAEKKCSDLAKLDG